MWRLLLLLSVLPIVTALIARWWFGMRILSDEGRRLCRCNPTAWPIAEAKTSDSNENSAAEFGRQLRLQALAEWKERDPKGASSRENSLRFGMAVPPLSAIVAIFAVIVAKIPVIGAFSILFAATALASALGLLSLAPELRLIAAKAREIRKMRSFPRSEDEDAVIKSAVAHAWKETLPPILSLIHK